MERGFAHIVAAPTHTFQDYARLLNQQTLTQLITVSRRLAGFKIVEINATAQGGGVAELLRSQMPLGKSLGVDVQWFTLPADAAFFTITKELHNRLQGNPSHGEPLDMEYYHHYLASLADALPAADLYVLHDPQTIGLAQYINKPMIWRCHIDLTNADSTTFAWLSSYYHYFAQLIFSMPEYARSVPADQQAIIRPAIDPLSDKNRDLGAQEQNAILHSLGLDQAQPYIAQVSRFDKFKNPQGVIDLYIMLLEQHPHLSCVLAGDYATDDPEGAANYIATRQYAQTAGKGNIIFVVGQTGVQINALQRGARVVLQNSSREGFGLTVTEALWKEKLVFTRAVGGIREQVTDGQTGFIMGDNLANNARRISQVVAAPQNYADITRNAHKLVKDHYITPVMLAQYFELYAKLLVT